MWSHANCNAIYFQRGMIEHHISYVIYNLNQYGFKGVHCDWFAEAARFCVWWSVICSSTPSSASLDELELCVTLILEHPVQPLRKGACSYCNKHSAPASSLPCILKSVSLCKSWLTLPVIYSHICLGFSKIAFYLIGSLILLYTCGSEILTENEKFSFNWPQCIYELHKWLWKEKWHLCSKHSSKFQMESHSYKYVCCLHSTSMPWQP